MAVIRVTPGIIEGLLFQFAAGDVKITGARFDPVMRCIEFSIVGDDVPGDPEEMIDCSFTVTYDEKNNTRQCTMAFERVKGKRDGK